MSNTLRTAGILALALAVPAVARAQDPEPAAVPTPEAPAELPTVDAVVTAVDATPATVEALSLVELTAEDVRITPVDDVFVGEDAAVLHDVVERNAEALTRLRETIQANPTLAAALAADEVTVEQVIGVDLSAADGGLTVYVHKTKHD